jgi:hypothetical protein
MRLIDRQRDVHRVSARSTRTGPAGDPADVLDGLVKSVSVLVCVRGMRVVSWRAGMSFAILRHCLVQQRCVVCALLSVSSPLVMLCMCTPLLVC